jgi:hypothetical protein
MRGLRERVVVWEVEGIRERAISFRCVGMGEW